MRKQSYVVLDVETTGLRPGRHRLTELYAKRCCGRGKIQEEFSSLINPQVPIPSFITRLTGITNEMVKNSPTADQVIEDFSKFLKPNDVLVGHNLRFDMGFLDYERQQSLQSSFHNNRLCTLLLSRRVFSPQPFPSYKLGFLSEQLGVSSLGAHRAQKDVEMTLNLKQELFRRLEAAQVTTIPDVLAFQYKPLAQASSIMTKKY